MSGGGEFLIRIKLSEKVVLPEPLSGLARTRRALILALAEIRNGYLGAKYGSCSGIAAIFRKYNLARVRPPVLIVSEPHVRHVEPMHIMRRRISV